MTREEAAGRECRKRAGTRGRSRCGGGGGDGGDGEDSSPRLCHCSLSCAAKLHLSFVSFQLFHDNNINNNDHNNAKKIYINPSHVLHPQVHKKGGRVEGAGAGLRVLLRQREMQKY